MAWGARLAWLVAHVLNIEYKYQHVSYDKTQQYPGGYVCVVCNRKKFKFSLNMKGNVTTIAPTLQSYQYRPQHCLVSEPSHPAEDPANGVSVAKNPSISKHLATPR